jgi:Cys-rich protein (TIGR01571 family)
MRTHNRADSSRRLAEPPSRALIRFEPMRPAAMTHRLESDSHLKAIAQMATVGGHSDVLMRGRPRSSGGGFDLSGRAKMAQQDERALVMLPNQPGSSASAPDARQAPSQRSVPVAPPSQPRSASYRTPDLHSHHHSMVAAVDGVAQKLRDEPLLDCLGDRETCLLCYFCPCVLVGRTAKFAGFDAWLCGCLWCLMPPCVGAVLRQSVAIKIAEDPPHILTSLAWNHCLCLPCSVTQEARVAKAARAANP